MRMRARIQAKSQRHKPSVSNSSLRREVLELRAENAELRAKVAQQEKQIEQLKRKYRDAKDEAHSWRDRYLKLQEQSREEIASLNLRIKTLEDTLEQVRSTLAWHEKTTFGDRSEKEDKPKAAAASSRGKRPGAPGYGRKERENLREETNHIGVPVEQRTCWCCGKPYRRLDSGDRSTVIELIQELIKVIDLGEKYVKDCSCDEGKKPRFVSSDPPARLFPRALLGPALWTDIFIEKFLFQKPLQRISQKYELLGAPVPVSTICSGLKKIDPLFDAMYEAIKNRAKGAEQWNMDETMWRVFGTNAQSKKWWLWVVVTADCCVYMLDPSRSADLPKGFFEGVSQGILISDRYSAYKSLVSSIRKAYCWAHVRRDFTKIRDGIPRLSRWAQGYIDSIGELFELNAKRTSVILRIRDDKRDFSYLAVKQKLEEIQQKYENDLKTDLSDRQKKVLTSLKKHWSGLTIFLDEPMVPMDNNAAERALRNPVVGRKNYYGSGSDWSGHLSAKIFSIFQTWLCNALDPIRMLQDFFTRTAQARGQPPPAEDYLPWTMSEERAEFFKLRKKR